LTRYFLIAAILAGGCVGTIEQGDEDYTIDSEQLHVSKIGTHFDATFTGGSVEIVASADVTAPNQYMVDLQVGTGHIQLMIDDSAGTADVNGGMVIDEAASESLRAFTRALYENLPVLSGVGDRVYRSANLYGNRSVGVEVPTETIRAGADLRGWTSLCSYYYNGWSYKAKFDEECHCSWGFCDQCVHYDTHVVGGDTHHGHCFGACGEGCGAGTDYTKDCANHDACVDGGYNWYECSDEETAASDDYLFAPNC